MRVGGEVEGGALSELGELLDLVGVFEGDREVGGGLRGGEDWGRGEEHRGGWGFGGHGPKMEGAILPGGGKLRAVRFPCKGTNFACMPGEEPERISGCDI